MASGAPRLSPVGSPRVAGGSSMSTVLSPVRAILGAIDSLAEHVHGAFDWLLATFFTATAASIAHTLDGASKWWTARIDACFSGGRHQRLGGGTIEKARRFRDRHVLPRRVEVSVVDETSGVETGTRWRRLHPGESVKGSRPYHECGELGLLIERTPPTSNHAPRPATTTHHPPPTTTHYPPHTSHHPPPPPDIPLSGLTEFGIGTALFFWQVGRHHRLPTLHHGFTFT